MNEIILLKLGELVLKGLNRRTFEDKLIANAKRRLKHHGDFKVYCKQSTMYVEPKNDNCDLDGAWEAMTKLFGVVGLFGLPILLSLLRYLNDNGTISLFPASALDGPGLGRTS